MNFTLDNFEMVEALSSRDVNAVTTCFPCRVVNLGRYEEMIAVVNIGQGSTVKIYVQAHSTVTGMTPGSTGNLCAFDYRVSGAGSTASTAGDWGDRTAVASTVGYYSHDATGSPNVLVALEVSGSVIPQDYPYCAVVISTSAQSSILGVQYLLKPRYPQETQINPCS